MSAEEIKSKLSLLTEDEREVLRLACQHPKHSDKDLSNDEKGGLGYLHWSSGKVRNLRREGLAAMRPFTPEEFCPYLTGDTSEESTDDPEVPAVVPVDTSPPDESEPPLPPDEPESTPPPDESEPPPQSEEVDEESTDDPEVPAVVPVDTSPPEEPEPTPQDPPGTPVVIDRGYHQIPRLIWTIVGLLAVIALASMLGNLNLWQRLRSQLPPVIEREVEVTRVVESIVEVTVPVEMTRIVELVEEVPVLQTVVIPQTVQVEVPVTVEVTPEPTTTSTPTSEDIIEEDFSDDELHPAITMIGDADFIDGVMLVSGAPVDLYIGDETWKNYSINYEWSFGTCVACGLIGQVQVRRQDNDNNFSFNNEYGWGDDYWNLVFDGTSRNKYAETNIPSPYNIRVEGNMIYGPGQAEVENVDYDSGGILIRVYRGEIDNLRVVRND